MQRPVRDQEVRSGHVAVHPHRPSLPGASQGGIPHIGGRAGVDVICPQAEAERELYRADSRGPEEIYSGGFEPWGDNMDLQAHVTGDSQDSGFVSTSMTREAADNWAQQNGFEYVYKLRGWGVDVNDTLDLSPESPFYKEQEMAIPSSVPGSDIMGSWGPDGWTDNSYYGR